MSFIEIFLIGIGLSMDAFAVSVTNGMCKREKIWAAALACGLCFGIFQGVMPALGYALGSTFAEYIEQYDHIIALVLLCYIGGKMILDLIRSAGGNSADEPVEVGSLKASVLILQGIATSIDALAVGVSFATMLSWGAMAGAASLIAATTFVIAAAGVFIGGKFGDILNNKAQLVGGLILIGIGVKIFVEHTFFS